MDRILKLLGLLLLTYIISLIYVVLTADTAKEKFILLILSAIGYLPQYAFAFILTIPLSLNNLTIKRRIIYPVILTLITIIIFMIHKSNTDHGYYEFSFFFGEAIPFFVIGIKTIHYWYKEWKGNW